ncbi:MAG TPA: lysophospholipid acyltransferase family protein [Actinomycetota bacterium]|nr:lysophospholipid acyltransferase family protein [Actinomycetota bacterium]
MEPVYHFARNVLVPLLAVFFRWKFVGLHKIPKTGPAIIAANHISYFDPLCHAFLVDRARRRPRFFAKAELWKNPFLRFILSNANQIPVERGTGETGPVEKAEEALARGQVVVIYPEATITTNIDLTPMQGKTGIARVALATGAPVIPAAVWGSQWVKPKGRKSVFTWRRLIMINLGDPMTFPDLVGKQDDPEVRREVTDRIVGELDRLVRELHKMHPDGPAVPELKERTW